MNHVQELLNVQLSDDKLNFAPGLFTLGAGRWVSPAGEAATCQVDTTCAGTQWWMALKASRFVSAPPPRLLINPQDVRSNDAQ